MISVDLSVFKLLRGTGLACLCKAYTMLQFCFQPNHSHQSCSFCSGDVLKCTQFIVISHIKLTTLLFIGLLFDTVTFFVEEVALITIRYQSLLMTDIEQMTLLFIRLLFCVIPVVRRLPFSLIFNSVTEIRLICPFITLLAGDASFIVVPDLEMITLIVAKLLNIVYAYSIEFFFYQ